MNFDELRALGNKYCLLGTDIPNAHYNLKAEDVKKLALGVLFLLDDLSEKTDLYNALTREDYER